MNHATTYRTHGWPVAPPAAPPATPLHERLRALLARAGRSTRSRSAHPGS
jgi:hypothetical protein